MASTAAVESVAGGIGSLIALVTTYPLKTIYTLQAIRLQQDSQGRSLSAAEKKELAGNPLKLLQSLLPSIGALYSGLQPAAIETTASNAVSSHSLFQRCHQAHALQVVLWLFART
eukprot:GHRQ01004986.1.p1 GENE.GHRQ01004986.1~~GHRQ01004986.1.p1  ORF type:complete len:115 (+),score=36.32 GHRQ01004986.1:226-570(+)